jgi:acetyl esterase/lipase
MKYKCWLFVLVVSCLSAAAQKQIPLPATGSEDWSWQEKSYFSPIYNLQIVYNVSKPSLEVYLPDSATANGTAIVICPGGGFRTLSINSEGIEVAKWLNKRGVTAFVLRYRLVHSLTDDPVKEMIGEMGDQKRFIEKSKPLFPLAIADARNALAYVRSHASDYGISATKIGIIGFSAGGTLAQAAAFGYTPENRPDFDAPIYAYVPEGGLPAVAGDAPPLFLVAASDDQLHLVPSSLLLYNAWLAAAKPVELHLYARGGHGFGMRKQNLPTDKWIDRFGDWLQLEGFIK